MLPLLLLLLLLFKKKSWNLFRWKADNWIFFYYPIISNQVILIKEWNPFQIIVHFLFYININNKTFNFFLPDINVSRREILILMNIYTSINNNQNLVAEKIRYLYLYLFFIYCITCIHSQTTKSSRKNPWSSRKMG